MPRKSKPADDQGSKSSHGGARPGAGRPRRFTLSDKEALEKARSRGRQALPDVVEGWIESLDAMEPIYWQGDRVDVVVNETARAEARRQLADRCGMPRENIVESVTANAALAAIVAGLAADLPNDADDAL